MKDKNFVWLLLPLFIANQSTFPIIEWDNKQEKPPEYQFEITDEGENEIIITNDTYEAHQAKIRRKKFQAIEQKMARLENEKPVLTATDKQIQLGQILASMSGGVLYGEKEFFNFEEAFEE